MRFGIRLIHRPSNVTEATLGWLRYCRCVLEGCRLNIYPKKNNGYAVSSGYQAALI